MLGGGLLYGVPGSSGAIVSVQIGISFWLKGYPSDVCCVTGEGNSCAVWRKISFFKFCHQMPILPIEPTHPDISVMGISFSPFRPRTPRQPKRPQQERPPLTVDAAVLEELAEMLGADEDPEYMQELLEDFFVDGNQLLGQIKQAIDTEDAGLLRQASHTLKSSSAMFGALPFSEICKTLEHLAAAGTTAGGRVHADWLEQHFPYVCEDLKSLGY